jgi:LPS-assembly protein
MTAYARRAPLRREGAPGNRRTLGALLALALLVARPGHVPALEFPGVASMARDGDGGGVTVEATTITYDQQANVITARGQVKITRGDMVLTAETVRVNRTTQVAEAQGSVVLTDPQGTLTADALTLDLVAETGNLEAGDVVLEKSRYQLSGRRFEKLPGQSYRIEGGSFTTCRCRPGDAPDWSVRGERVTLDLDGYGTVQRGVFDVKGVPVFYVPYGIFPLKRERQTGLLFPRLGFSNTRGFQIEQPFYVAIDKSTDATVAVDLETAARVGVLGEFRYALSQKTLGELYGSYFNEQIRGASSEDVVNSDIADPDIPLHRWSAGATHDQKLPLGMRGFADVFRVSDDLFLREINLFSFNPDVGVALRTRRFERSRVGVERQFARGAVVTSGTWYQDFINPDDFVFQTPPRLEARATQRFFDDRLALNFAGEGVNFARDEGYEGQRLDLGPELELPWRLGRYAYGSWRGGFRETLYSLGNTDVPPQVNFNPADPGSKPPTILALDDNATREVFYVHGQAGTSLSRVIPFRRFGFTAVKHTIEPELDYLYVPRTDTRQATLPLFDDVDRVNRRSVFTYGMTSRLLARVATDADAAGDAVSDEVADVGAAGDPGAFGPPVAPRRGPIRELGRFSIFQSYDVNTKGGDFIDEVDPDTGEVIRDEGDRASDLALHLRLTPAPFLGFEGRTDYGVASGRPKGAFIGLMLSDPRTPADDFVLASLRGRTRVGVGYRFVANSAVEEINWSMVFRLTKRYYAAYEARYDNISKRFLENNYGLRVISDCECWIVDIGVSDQVNPDETQVRVLVSLVGLGQVGKEPFRQSLGAIAAPSRSYMNE